MNKLSVFQEKPEAHEKGGAYGPSVASILRTVTSYFNVSHLFLLPEFCFHLFVARLVLPDAVSSYEVAADVSQLWVLFASFLYQSKEIIHILKLSVGEGTKFRPCL